MNSRAKSTRALSSTRRHAESCPAEEEALRRENRALREQMLKLKEINLHYARLLGELLAGQCSDAGEAPGLKRLMDRNRQALAANAHLREELELYGQREQQFERLEEYLRDNGLASLSELVGRFEKQGRLPLTQRA